MRKIKPADSAIRASMEEAVNEFLSRSNQDQSSLMVENGVEWSELAPGQHLADYKPSDPIPINEAPSYTSLTERDTGPVLGAVTTSAPSSRNNIQAQDGTVGVCGLHNSGNTCYMNAGLQCVRSVPKIASFFLEGTVDHDSNDGGAAHNNKKVVLSKVFCEIVRKLWCGQFASININYFKNTFDLLHPQFKGHRQQDSQEFLAMLLDTLHEECQSASSSSVISETFQGQLCNEVVCVQCHHKSIKKEPFVYLSLPLPGAHLREIEFLWVPLTQLNQPEVMKMIVQVPKNQFVADVKTALCELIDRGLPKHLLVLAEVNKHSIRRTLADSFPLKDMSFENGRVFYMYELHPVNELANTLTLEDDPWSSPIATENTNSEQQTQEGIDVFGSEQFSPNETTPSNDVNTPPLAGVLVKWHTCSICLEEMVDSDLLVHAECGGLVCAPCLQGTVQHYSSSNEAIPCPICSVSVSAKDSFTPLASETNKSKHVISFMQVTILFRKSSGELFAHPKLVGLPSECSGGVYYRLIEAILPSLCPLVQWKLCLTGFNGKVCSRCDYSEMCSGCPVERSIGSSLKLKPGDHLTVQLLTDSHAHQFEHVTEHSSILDDERGKPLSLTKCLEAFSKSEALDCDNPWFCSSCKQRCPAVRTLSVSSIPATLIIHLKRFSYHLTTGMKLDAAVEFPMELDASIFFAQSGQSKLHLTSCVCHYGTLHSGHYTAYVKHPVTHEWIYYNDSTVSKDVPSTKDLSNVYILFYQMESHAVYQLPISVSTEVFDEQLLPSQPELPLPPLKRSSSDLNISKLGELDLPARKNSTKTLSAMSPW